MKTKLQFFFMLICLGLFIMPKQLLLAESTQMECCSQKTETVSCHQDQKEDSGTGKKNQNNHCSGNCCTNCGTCSAFSISALEPEFSGTFTQNIIYVQKQAFIYNEPALTLNSKDIWQPPKIS